MPKRISFDQFLERFRPQRNHISIARAYDGLLFETFGPDEAHVLGADIRSVWTLVDCDGVTVVLSGRHYVNRLGYFLCEVMWSEEMEAAAES